MKKLNKNKVFNKIDIIVSNYQSKKNSFHSKAGTYYF
jgi:hypothetical protein